MKVKYFHDTGTVLIEFSTQPIIETIEINENMYLDLGSEGNPVAITIEHANIHADLPEMFYEQIEATESQLILHEKTESSL